MDALIKRDLKPNIECRRSGGSTWYVKANRARASEGVTESDTLFLEPGGVFVHLQLFAGALLFEGRAQGDVERNRASAVEGEKLACWLRVSLIVA